MISFEAKARATISAVAIKGQVLQLIEYFQILKASGGNSASFLAETANE